MRLALLALCACAGAPPKPAPSDPLAELNRAAYAEARDRALASAGPALIVGPARITLLRAGARSEFELSPARYHDLRRASAWQGAGEGFFGDPRRMHCDLLSDAAAQVLAIHREPPLRNAP